MIVKTRAGTNENERLVFLSRDLRIRLKVDLSLAGEDCQHAVTDESLCTVTGCALGTDVYNWMFKTKVNMVQG